MWHFPVSPPQQIPGDAGKCCHKKDHIISGSSKEQDPIGTMECRTSASRSSHTKIIDRTIIVEQCLPDINDRTIAG